MTEALRIGSPAVPAESSDVSLTVPAKPGYLVLTRLALAAVCRLTALEATAVADLKLAVTEAASELIEAGGDDDTLDLTFRLHPDLLAIELSGPVGAAAPHEHELSRAIIEATVDRAEFSAGRTVLSKRLDAS